MNTHNLAFCRLSLTEKTNNKRRLNLKMVIPASLAFISGGILFADSIDGISIPDVGKIGLTGVLGYAVFALWRELKASRKEFVNYLLNSKEKENDLRERQITSNERLSDTLESLSRITQSSHETIKQLAQSAK